MIYDLIIVGAGPCGIYAAWEAAKLAPSAKILMIDRGYDIYNRKCPIMSKKARLCPMSEGKDGFAGCLPACSVTCGFGGAGAYSDGKFNITSEFGGWLGDYMPASKLLELIDELNNRADIHGILVQLPLPKGYSEQKVIQAISPAKDVDAFTLQNVGRIMNGEYDFAPCTPAGVMDMLEEYGIDPAGKHCVVIGRSNIVGKPMAMLLLHKHATVTICHSRTANLAEITRQADILVAAVGKIGLVTADMVKPGAVVIDIAVNRNEKGKLCGDVDFNAVKEIASHITPVPGGVGPMTRAVLMQNTLKAAKGNNL